jgi:hypothetical protein
MKAGRAAISLALAVLALAAAGCRGRSVEGWSTRARDMLLTSGPTQVVVSSSRVPGYWARQSGSDQDVFLYTKDRSFEAGNWVTVAGPFGGSYMDVFGEETGVYMKDCSAPLLVVWKISRTANVEDP